LALGGGFTGGTGVGGAGDAAAAAAALALAMAHDGRTLALGALGEWERAVASSQSALAAAGLGGLKYASGGGGLDVPVTAPNAGLRGRGLHSVTSQLNLSAFCGTGGARRGYVARVKGVLEGV